MTLSHLHHTLNMLHEQISALVSNTKDEREEHEKERWRCWEKEIGCAKLRAEVSRLQAENEELRSRPSSAFTHVSSWSRCVLVDGEVSPQDIAPTHGRKEVGE